ncbi:MAG: hypothetical protein V3S29_03300 [bacterium]
MKVILDFTRSWFKMRQPWPIWLGVLMFVNMMGPLFFLDTAEGQATLAVFMASAMVMMGLFAALGWVRLLGAGHFLWLGLVPWLWLRLDSIEPATALYYWGGGDRHEFRIAGDRHCNERAMAFGRPRGHRNAGLRMNW